jgi:potassium channel subfamily K
MMHLTFIDGLYFSIVTNLTIGFGDTTAQTSVQRGVTCLQAAFGIVILGSAVRLIGEAVMENLEMGYRRRMHDYHHRRSHEKRADEAVRWREACETQLSAKGAPIWVPDVPNTGAHPAAGTAPEKGGKAAAPPRKVLNVAALDAVELKAAAQAANVPLEHFRGQPVWLEVDSASDSESALERVATASSHGTTVAVGGKDASAAHSPANLPRNSMWWARTYQRLAKAKGVSRNKDGHLEMHVDTIQALEIEEKRSVYLQVCMWCSRVGPRANIPG